MKIHKRVKGILRFKTTIGNVTLTDENEGINELTSEQFDAIKAHPMYEALCKTSGLKIVDEAASVEAKKEESFEEEAEAEVESEEGPEEDREETVDVKVALKGKNGKDKKKNK